MLYEAKRNGRNRTVCGPLGQAVSQTKGHDSQRAVWHSLLTRDHLDAREFAADREVVEGSQSMLPPNDDGLGVLRVRIAIYVILTLTVAILSSTIWWLFLT